MSQSIGSKVKTFFKSMMKPSPAAVFQAVKSLKPHVPMIKFRYGVAAHSGMSAPSSPAALQSRGAQPSGGRSAPATPSKPNARVTLPIIEDWQLPARYHRRPLDPVEIDYINRGGPEWGYFIQGSISVRQNHQSSFFNEWTYFKKINILYEDFIKTSYLVLCAVSSTSFVVSSNCSFNYDWEAFNYHHQFIEQSA